MCMALLLKHLSFWLKEWILNFNRNCSFAFRKFPSLRSSSDYRQGPISWRWEQQSGQFRPSAQLPDLPLPVAGAVSLFSRGFAFVSEWIWLIFSAPASSMFRSLYYTNCSKSPMWGEGHHPQLHCLWLRVGEIWRKVKGRGSSLHSQSVLPLKILLWSLLNNLCLFFPFYAVNRKGG